MWVHNALTSLQKHSACSSQYSDRGSATGGRWGPTLCRRYRWLRSQPARTTIQKGAFFACLLSQLASLMQIVQRVVQLDPNPRLYNHAFPAPDLSVATRLSSIQHLFPITRCGITKLGGLKTHYTSRPCCLTAFCASRCGTCRPDLIINFNSGSCHNFGLAGVVMAYG